MNGNPLVYADKQTALREANLVSFEGIRYTLLCSKQGLKVLDLQSRIRDNNNTSFN